MIIEKIYLFKGKGTVNSFWLLGKETADREEVSIIQI